MTDGLQLFRKNRVIRNFARQRYCLAMASFSTPVQFVGGGEVATTSDYLINLDPAQLAQDSDKSLFKKIMIHTFGEDTRILTYFKFC